MRFHIKSILTKARLFVRKNKTAVFLLLIACFLRFYNLADHSMFLGDQGRDAIIIKRIALLEHWPAIGAPTSIGQVFLGPFYYYLVAPFLLLANFNPVGLSAGVAILSLFGLILSYLVVKQEFNQLIANIFLFLTVFSGAITNLSRFSWNPNLLSFFTLFTVYYFYQTLKNKQLINPLLFGALFAFSIQLHYLGILVAPVFLLFSLVFFYKERQKLVLIKKLFISALSFIVFSASLIIFDLRHQFINTNSFLKMFAQEKVVDSGSYSYRFFDTSKHFFIHTFNLELSNILTLIILILVFVVTLKLAKKGERLFLSILLFTFYIFIFTFSFLNSGRYEHYFGPVYLIFFIPIAFIFGTKAKACQVCKTIILILLLLFAYNNFSKYSFIFKEGPRQVWRTSKIADFLAEKINNKPYNISTWPVEFSEDPYTYFLELKGLVPADRKKIEISKQMFVLCEREPCLVIDSPSWNISMFGKAKIAKIWTVEGLIIYKLVHQ